MKKFFQKFRKLHWVDTLILSAAVVVLVGFFFFFYRKSTYITIRFKVTNQEVLTAHDTPRNDYSWRFRVGDVERDVVGRTIAEIVNVESYPITPENKVVYLDIRLRATYDTRTKLYSARGKNLMYGTPMRFNLHDVTFDGIVTDVPGIAQVNATEKVIHVKTFLASISPTLAKEIHVGDTVTNSLGKQMVKITKVEVTPATQVTQDIYGNFQIRKHPIAKDVVVWLDLTVRVVNNDEVVMFDGYRVHIGSEVPINQKRYNIYPAIDDIEGL